MLRGPVAEADRRRYVRYEVPAGPTLLLLDATLRDPSRPFVAVHEDGASRHWPEIPAHPSGARAIRHASFHGSAVPDLGEARPRDVRFEVGRPMLELEWDGPAPPWTHRPGRSA